MKLLVLAAALTFSSAAYAQTNTGQQPPAEEVIVVDETVVPAPPPPGPTRVVFGPPINDPPMPTPKVYPVCTRTLQDECRNPGAK